MNYILKCVTCFIGYNPNFTSTKSLKGNHLVRLIPSKDSGCVSVLENNFTLSDNLLNHINYTLLPMKRKYNHVLDQCIIRCI